MICNDLGEWTPSFTPVVPVGNRFALYEGANHERSRAGGRRCLCPQMRFHEFGSNGMRENVERMSQRESRPSLRASHLPSLSVVLLSHGDRSELERALAAVAGRCRRMEAEIIVVRESALDDAATLGAAYPSVTFIETPVGVGSASMREVGMNRATGDIVALRMDGAVGDGMWLEAFDATVGSVEDGTLAESEIPLVATLEETAVQGDRRRSRAYLTPSVAAASRRKVEGVRGVAGVLESDSESFGTSITTDA